MQKILYAYDIITKEFLQEEYATLDPITGKYLGRTFTSDKKPPEKKENELIIFNEEKNDWEIIPDFRGKTFYFRNEKGIIDSKYIKDAGAIPENYFEDINDIPLTQEEKEDKIRGERNQKLYETDIQTLRKIENLILKMNPDDTFDTALLKDFKKNAKYRQELRDLPKNTDFPEIEKWPVNQAEKE